jgi:lipopolysaccharide biosynthesis glycosyltransferase
MKRGEVKKRKEKGKKGFFYINLRRWRQERVRERE